ncbi:MAG: 2-hydroxyacid dehydrogenase, partial [Pseudomonadales bacterium]|nr:2-hydroxyacid dehydrogenase [Pseudomonadales bacterium]
ATASWMTNPLIYTLPKLEIIACFGVGTDGIDFTITRERGIAVTNTPDVLNDAVADIAIALILATQRKLIQADRFVRAGQWLQEPFPFGSSLAGKTLGIIGLGSIGEEIVRRALPFKLKIAYHNRHPKPLPYTYCNTIEELAEISDILLCMLPGGRATEKLVNQQVFEKLGPQGTFINVGRGTSVDEAALVQALQDGSIAGAGLDVYSREPNVPQALLSMNNVVLLPHIGSATVETRKAMGQLVIDNLAAWRNGGELITLIE